MRVTDMPFGERPRERLWDLGPEALADRELLALLRGLRDEQVVVVGDTGDRSSRDPPQLAPRPRCPRPHTLVGRLILRRRSQPSHRRPRSERA